ncbi:MAG: hypothetical protein JRJ24_03350 [Deltaproteobacteria bacterium]|nr:hypothetical protein [Deltaproteobacteria bacterium]
MHAPGLDIRYGGRVDAPLTYKAFVMPKRRGFPEPIPSDLREHYVAVPAGYERVAALAQSLIGTASNPHAQAQLVERYLRVSGNFRYTLDHCDGDHDEVDRPASPQRHGLSRCRLQPLR